VISEALEQIKRSRTRANDGAESVHTVQQGEAASAVITIADRKSCHRRERSAH
jgi:hypothetical protein